MSSFDSEMSSGPADNSANAFDPYYQWLSIPPAEQPPNHYRLLGIEPFEASSDVISSVADRQAGFVRSFKIGSHSSDCERLLTEIFQAKVCLLDGDRKAEYDQGLRNQLAVESEPVVPHVGVALTIRPKRRKKKSGSWEVVKVVLGGMGGTVLAILILWYGFGLDPFGLMAPKKPKQFEAPLAGGDVQANSKVIERFRRDLLKANSDVTTARRLINELQADNVRLKHELLEKRPVQSQEKQGWIDLLELIDVEKHAVSGTWTRNEDGITTEPLAYSRISLPVFLDCSYELSIDFTRHTSNEAVSVILPIQTTSCLICFCGWAGTVHGLGFIDGKNLDTWPENHELAKMHPINNEQRYRLNIHVNIQRDSVTISSQLDQKPLLTWQGEINRLSGHPLGVLPNRNSLGLMAYENRCTFHRVELRLLDSTTIVLVPADPKEGDGK